LAVPALLRSPESEYVGARTHRKEEKAGESSSERLEGRETPEGLATAVGQEALEHKEEEEKREEKEEGQEEEEEGRGRGGKQDSEDRKADLIESMFDPIRPHPCLPPTEALATSLVTDVTDAATNPATPAVDADAACPAATAIPAWQLRPQHKDQV
jgi:hypothetical protein